MMMAMASVRQVFLDTAATVASLLRDPAVAASWDKPSALAAFQVSGLAGHLAWQILAVPARLTAGPGGQPVAIVEHYARAAWVGASVDDDINVALRDVGEQTATDGPDALATQVDAALAELRVGLPTVDAALTVTLGASCLTIDDFLVTRLLELVIHADDLAVSIDVPTPTFPTDATDTVLALLTRLATRRHGPLALQRTHSRAERAPTTVAAL
jgi:hypothetical protein